MSNKLLQERFDSDYEVFRIRFLSRFKNCVREENETISFLSEETPDSVIACTAILNSIATATRKEGNRDLNTKHKLLNLARREEVFHYNCAECANGILQLRNEAHKIEVPWRRNTILALLDKYDSNPVSQDTLSEARASLYEARLIRDTHFDNVYFKMSLMKKTLNFMNWAMACILLIVLASTLLPPNGADSDAALGSFSDVSRVLMYGLLGAAFSILLNLFVSKRLQNSIIRQLDVNSLTTVRLLIGACAGLVIYTFLVSGLVSVKGISEDGKFSKAMLPLIFVAGFTEKLVLNFIGKFMEEKPQQGNASQ